MKQKICFIVNPASGVGRKQYLKTYIDRYLDTQRYDYTIRHTKAPQHATALARSAVQEGAAVVVAVGGDGSVNEVVAGLIGSPVALAVLPLGSGNAFATHIGISRRLKAAFSVINTQKTMLSDVAWVNKRPYVATSGVGFAAYIANQIKGKEWRGLLRYTLIALQAALSYESKTYRIQLDQNPVWLTRKCLVVEVSNGKYYGYNLAIAPQADITDGRLDITLILDRPRWQYIVNLWRMLAQNLDKADFIETYTAQSVTIVAPNNTPLHRDGEGDFSAETTLHYSVQQQVLKVLIP